MNFDNPPFLVCFWIFWGFSVFLIGKIECVFLYLSTICSCSIVGIWLLLKKFSGSGCFCWSLIFNRFIHKSISFVPIFLCIFSLICGHGSFPTAFTWDITIRIFSETGILVDRAEGSWVHLQAKFKAFPFVKVSTFAMRRKFCDNLGLFYLSKSNFLYPSISRFGSGKSVYPPSWPVFHSFPSFRSPLMLNSSWHEEKSLALKKNSSIHFHVKSFLFLGSVLPLCLFLGNLHNS